VTTNDHFRVFNCASMQINVRACFVEEISPKKKGGREGESISESENESNVGR
jgi:hypothetical protein